MCTYTYLKATASAADPFSFGTRMRIIMCIIMEKEWFHDIVLTWFTCSVLAYTSSIANDSLGEEVKRVKG